MVECPKWSNGVLTIGQMAENVNQIKWPFCQIANRAKWPKDKNYQFFGLITRVFRPWRMWPFELHSYMTALALPKMK